MRRGRVLRRRNLVGPASWLRLVVAAAMLWFIPASAAASSRPQTDLPCAEVTWNAVTDTPDSLRNCRTTAASSTDPAQIARSFLEEQRAAFGMPRGLADLRVVDVKHGLGSSRVLLQQTYDNLPVYGAYTSVNLDRNHQIQVVHNGYLPDLAVNEDSASVTAVQAVQLARRAIGFGAPRSSNPAPGKIVLPLSSTEGRRVWRVMILAAEPQGDWEVFVDAATGEVLKRYNRLVLAKGQIFEPSPTAPAGWNDNATPPIRTQTLQGLDNSGWLRGEYVDVTTPTGYRPAAAFSPTGDFRYGPDDPRFGEVMVYHYVDATQRYVQSLGYSNDNVPANGIRERVTQASAHWFAQDQSFYSISDDALHFGDGGVPDAQDPDIIVHEYGHALQHDQLACWSATAEMDAIGEGFGDFLAASRFAESSADPACIAEWDSQGYASSSAQCLRRVDRDRQVPKDVSGDIHADGEIWSRVLWDVRAAVGARKADTLAIESNFYLPCNATLADAGRALIDADANVYAGANENTIRQVLMARGLLAPPAPTVLAPNGGETLSPHTLVSLSWQPGGAPAGSYEVQYSLNADAVGRRADTFGGRLPADYISFGNLPWRTEGGVVHSGAIDHNQSSTLALTVDLKEAGPLSFRYRVSSEQGWDVFEFLVDGQRQIEASGEVGWTPWSIELAPGQHDLVWRYSKDGTLSGGQDGAWIDDVTLDRVSTAIWQDAELMPGNTDSNGARWRVPDDASQAAEVRVRSRLGDVTSPWDASDRTLVIDEPTAVSLSSFQAGAGRLLAGHIPLVPWGLIGMLAAVCLGAAAGLMLSRRRT